MIQFLKGHTHKGRKLVIGDKVTFIPEVEDDLIKKGIAQSTKWNGKTEKLKTDLFKPKIKSEVKKEEPKPE